MTSKEIKALTREELNLKISEISGVIRKEKDKFYADKALIKKLTKDLQLLVKEFNRRNYGLIILHK